MILTKTQKDIGRVLSEFVHVIKLEVRWRMDKILGQVTSALTFYISWRGLIEWLHLCSRSPEKAFVSSSNRQNDYDIITRSRNPATQPKHFVEQINMYSWIAQCVKCNENSNVPRTPTGSLTQWRKRWTKLAHVLTINLENSRTVFVRENRQKTHARC